MSYRKHRMKNHENIVENTVEKRATCMYIIGLCLHLFKYLNPHKKIAIHATKSTADYSSEMNQS
jgi:hypothetical protein